MELNGLPKIIVTVAVMNLVAVSFIAAGVVCVMNGMPKTAVTCFVFGMLTSARPNVTLR